MTSQIGARLDLLDRQLSQVKSVFSKLELLESQFEQAREQLLSDPVTSMHFQKGVDLCLLQLGQIENLTLNPSLQEISSLVKSKLEQLNSKLSHAANLASDPMKKMQAIELALQEHNGQSATIATLNINGVSVLNHRNMAFPVGFVLPMGQPGDMSNYTPSEAFGYAMRNAVAAKDKAFFQRLLNGYLYLINQTTLYRQNVHRLPDDMLAIGLIGWSPNIVNISSGASPYDSNLPNSFVSSASDAEIDIITAMIDAKSLWNDMVATDPVSSSGSHTIPSIGIQDLIKTAIRNFVDKDLGIFTENEKSYYGLTLNNWGHDAPYPNYFDPCAFAKMIQFVGPDSTLGESLVKAAQGTIQFIKDEATRGQGWIPDTPRDHSKGPSGFSYDAVRILMRFGEYVASNQDPLNMATDVKNVLKDLVRNLFSNNHLNWENGTVTFTPSGLSLGQFTGPLLVALKALQNSGDLPSNVTAKDVSNLQNCLNHDLMQHKVGTMKDWQQCYFAIQLALLSQSLIRNFSK